MLSWKNVRLPLLFGPEHLKNVLKLFLNYRIHYQKHFYSLRRIWTQSMIHGMSWNMQEERRWVFILFLVHTQTVITGLDSSSHTFSCITLRYVYIRSYYSRYQEGRSLFFFFNLPLCNSKATAAILMITHEGRVTELPGCFGENRAHYRCKLRFYCAIT